MVTEEEYFERGLKNLSENPPNLIKALSLLRKAKDIFEEKGMVKKINSCKDKIEYIYKTLARNEYEKANMFLKKSEYKNSIMKSLESYKFILKSEPNDIDKALKKVKSLIEEAIIQLLYDIERRSMKKGYSEDAINELSFAEKTILSVFFPNLKENTENGVIPEKFINKIGERKKLQRSLINSYEMLGNKARSKGAKLLNDGNINKGHEMINIARELYEKSDFFEKIKSLLPLYYQVYEALGDAEYTLGQKMTEKGRLERGRRHIKKARDYFKEARCNKKIDLAKKTYLKISLTIGENILNDANNALKIGDLTSAVSFFDTAFNFFKGLNHKKNMSKAD
ncbi:MAG: hypothetical protein GY870_03020, partial [archaeon]|nr:hypothetical protein [archaeon]